MKKDDCSLSAQDEAEIRRHADLLLRRADAHGRFPTPVGDLVSVAGLRVEPKVSLDVGFFQRLYRAVAGPIKRAIEKVRGLLDRRGRTIYLDQTVHKSKKTFLSIHETGHDFLPWQRATYAVLEDCEHHLDPEVQDLFERQANVFASEVLFQLDRFRDQAADYELGIRTPLELAKRYGASCYAAVRRYVCTNRRACAVLVLNDPVYEAGRGLTVTLRRSFQSPAFTSRFGDVRWPEQYGPDDFLTSVLPVGRPFARPTCCQLTNRNRESEECVLEAFNSTYQVFVLIYPGSELRRPTPILAG